MSVSQQNIALANEFLQRPVVTLRPEGLYCPYGDFFIDPWQPVSRAVITHAHGDHARGGSKEYISAKVGEQVLSLRLNPEAQIVTREYGEKFKLKDALVSLHPAGHILGSSQVRIETSDGVWVISGDYKRGFDPTCQPFEVVPCDVFITEATFAVPIYRWQSGRETAIEILEWWRHCEKSGSTALLFCYALGKAQRVLAELATLGNLPAKGIRLHGAMLSLTKAYREAGVLMAPTSYLDETINHDQLAGSLVLAPPSAYRSPWMKRFRSFETGFASGWVRVRGALRQRGHDRAFVLSDHADWPELIQTIRETGAKHCLVTHGRPDILIRYLNEDGQSASALKTHFSGEEGEV